MNTATAIPRPLRLYRPWWERLFDRLRPTDTNLRPDLRDLAGLSDATLRDIGAFDGMAPRAKGVALWEMERARW